MANQETIQTVETKKVTPITPAKKVAPKKVQAKKAAGKTTAKKTTPKKVAKKAAVKAQPKVSIKYNVIARPGSGALLKAHTAAMLTFFNMLTPAKKAAPLNHVRQIWGDTAIGYHSRIGNVSKKDGKVSLTTKGRNFFTDRKKAAHYDESVRDAYLAVMQGKPATGDSAKAIHGYKVTTVKG